MKYLLCLLILIFSCTTETETIVERNIPKRNIAKEDSCKFYMGKGRITGKDNISADISDSTKASREQESNECILIPTYISLSELRTETMGSDWQTYDGKPAIKEYYEIMFIGKSSDAVEDSIVVQSHWEPRQQNTYSIVFEPREVRVIDKQVVGDIQKTYTARKENLDLANILIKKAKEAITSESYIEICLKDDWIYGEMLMSVRFITFIDSVRVGI